MRSTGPLKSRGLQPKPDDRFGFGALKHAPDRKECFCQEIGMHILVCLFIGKPP